MCDKNISIELGNKSTSNITLPACNPYVSVMQLSEDKNLILAYIHYDTKYFTIDYNSFFYSR